MKTLNFGDVIDFGDYEGLKVEEVAVLDSDYIVGLSQEYKISQDVLDLAYGEHDYDPEGSIIEMLFKGVQL